jgi:allantoin racemase
MKDHDEGHHVRIRWVNPLGISLYDESIAEVIRTMKRPETEVEVVSFKMLHSPRDLSYRTYEALMSADIIRVTRDAAEKGFDAVVIGCFYDPNLLDAREISGHAVVVAPCEASVNIATTLANRFSVIVGEEKWSDQMTATIQSYGRGGALASMRALGLTVGEFQKNPKHTKRLMLQAGRKAIDEDRAEALVLGCTIEFGFYEEMQQRLGVPVIDCTLAALKTAEFHGLLKRQFQWSHSRVGGCAPPPEKDIRESKIFDAPVPIGNRIVIGASRKA